MEKMERGTDLDEHGRQPPAADSVQESKEASIVDSSPQKDEIAPDEHPPGEDAHDALNAQQPRSPYDGNTARRLLTPKNCRWDAASPPPLTTFLCVIYALVGFIPPSPSPQRVRARRLTQGSRPAASPCPTCTTTSPS